MSARSYAKGFCKVAAAYGVSPAELLKYAQEQEEEQPSQTPQEQAQQSADRNSELSSLRSEILPRIQRLMAGAQRGETRRFDPDTQELVNRFTAAGGDPNQLKL